MSNLPEELKEPLLKALRHPKSGKLDFGDLVHDHLRPIYDLRMQHGDDQIRNARMVSDSRILKDKTGSPTAYFAATLVENGIDPFLNSRDFLRAYTEQ